jgi:hypothetical protein
VSGYGASTEDDIHPVRCRIAQHPQKLFESPRVAAEGELNYALADLILALGLGRVVVFQTVLNRRLERQGNRSSRKGRSPGNRVRNSETQPALG